MLSNLNPFDSGESGETLCAKWGERLLPASWRVSVIDDSIDSVANAIRNSAKYSQAMQAKSNSDAGKAIDKIINPEVVMNNLTAEEVGVQTDKIAAKPPESRSTESNVLNLDVAREAVTRSFGDNR